MQDPGQLNAELKALLHELESEDAELDAEDAEDSQPAQGFSQPQQPAYSSSQRSSELDGDDIWQPLPPSDSPEEQPAARVSPQLSASARQPAQRISHPQPTASSSSQSMLQLNADGIWDEPREQPAASVQLSTQQPVQALEQMQHHMG